MGRERSQGVEIKEVVALVHSESYYRCACDIIVLENLLALECVLHRAAHSLQLGVSQSHDLHACGHERQLNL